MKKINILYVNLYLQSKRSRIFRQSYHLYGGEIKVEKKLKDLLLLSVCFFLQVYRVNSLLSTPFLGRLCFIPSLDTIAA